jgi:hypothetical protein
VTAVIAIATGGGVEGDDTIARAESGDASADLVDGTGKLMSKGDGGLEHAGVITAAVDLEVGSTGKGGMDAHDDFTGTGLRHRNLFNPQVLAAVEHGGCHVRCHLSIVSNPGLLRLDENLHRGGAGI